MNYQCRLEIMDRDGWRKTFQVEKAIVYIGSDPGDDIVLDRLRGSGVGSRHIQLIAPSVSGGPYRLVNLGDTDITVGPESAGAERTVSPRSFAAIADGETLRLGDFRIAFRSAEYPAFVGTPGAQAAIATPGAAPILGSSRGAIGLRLALPSNQLLVDHPLAGSVIVANQGDKAGVQFLLQVDGLAAESYEIGPGPLLFPGAEKAVPLRLVHTRGPRPAAGVHRLTIHATAPDAYPGDSAAISQDIVVAPHYAHSIRLGQAGQAVEAIGNA